ncbi:MAG: hypothetical protein JSV56_12300 [Methanomassiliicoccales archaeon]|nr:MAG: hypothetical protein JSV56_12300 [Methanomassiliicoccales archaeon]
MQKEIKALIIGLIVVFIVIASIGGFIYLIIVAETVERGQSSEYKLEIITNDTANYILHVPLAVNDDESVSELMDDLHITEGKATHETIQTEHGMALKIEANESVCLMASETKQILRPHLSMLNDTSEDGAPDYSNLEFWLYCDKSVDSTNITLSIHLTIESWRDWYNGLGMHKWYSSSTREEQIKDVTVTSGWQKVPGYILMELAN